MKVMQQESLESNSLHKMQKVKTKTKKMKIKEKKLTNGHSEGNGIPTEEETIKSSAPIKQKTENNTTKVVNKNIFQYFTALNNADEKVRTNAALQLIQHLSKTKEPEKHEQELEYTLKRLVRGCGASTNNPRSGFFTALVALLKAFNDKQIPLQSVFKTMVKELHVGASITNKEDADAIVGQIMTCGAVIHSERAIKSDTSLEELTNITNTLVQATRHRNYHASLAYCFLEELMALINQERFEAVVWPELQKEVLKPWPKQTLQSVNCLLAVWKHFPAILNEKFIKQHFGGSELLNSKSFEYFHKMFWHHTNIDILMHPAIGNFGAYIAKCKSLSDFWQNYVDAALKTPTKLLEIITIKIATDILKNIDDENSATVLTLLSNNFLNMFVQGLKNIKQKKLKEDDTLRAFYSDFLDVLINHCSKLSAEKNSHIVAVIKSLIMPPYGAFNIEKFTNNRIVHQLISFLNADGVKEMFELFKGIFLATVPKNVENSTEKWTHFERLNAGYMLQHLLAHKTRQQKHKWRGKQLKFLLTCGVFYVSDEDIPTICKKEKAGSFSEDFAEQCKNMFYLSLQSKLQDLEAERKILIDLVEFCNENMQHKHPSKFFRVKDFNETLQQTWQRMYEAVSCETSDVNTDTSKKKKDSSKKTVEGSEEKLQLVFHILLLTMGLQMFREPETAIPAIEDLLKCIARIKEQKNRKSVAVNGDAEPEWIEVVVDLFLHLLSKNASALRNVVNSLFPHLCSNLSLSAVHQILAMLDMKSNPLTAIGNEDESDEDDDDDENEDEDNDNEHRSKKANKNINKKQKREADEENDSSSDSEEEANIETKKSDAEEDDDDDDDDDDDEEDEDDDEEEDEEEDVTESDKLRNAISQALMTTGAAVDDDMDSVDLNDMTEEEGRRLDEALASAFKAMKKSGAGTQNKKSKSFRIQNTTVMHFRIRVLDLIEIYLQHEPTLLISIEIMLALYNMLETRIEEDTKPLFAKIEKVLSKLTSIKTYALDADLSNDKLTEFLRIIVEKKVLSTNYELTNRLRNKCAVFLVSYAIKLHSPSQKINKILELCREYLQEFIKSRNPTANISLFSELFKLRWDGIWDLAQTLTQDGINNNTRTFRRIQAYDILSVLYKNNELQKVNENNTKKQLNQIENILADHIKNLLQSCEAGVKQSPREFKTLLELLLNINKTNARLQLKSLLNSNETHNHIQSIRKHVHIESAQMYHRYCGTFKLSIIRNNKVSEATKTVGNDVQKSLNGESLQNGIVNSEDDETGEQSSSKSNIPSVTEQKKKRKQADKQKKLKKQKRMLAASKGLSEDFTFASRVNGVGGRENDGSD